MGFYHIIKKQEISYAAKLGIVLTACGAVSISE